MEKIIILLVLLAVFAGGCRQTAKKQTPEVNDSITVDTLVVKE